MTTPPAVSLKAKSTLSSLASQKVQGFNNHEFLITTSHGYISCLKKCVSDLSELILLSSYGAISRETAHFTTFLFKTNVFSSILLHISSSKRFLENLKHTFVPTSLLYMLKKDYAISINSLYLLTRYVWVCISEIPSLVISIKLYKRFKELEK